MDNDTFHTEIRPDGSTLVRTPVGEATFDTKEEVNAYFAGIRIGLDLGKKAMNECLGPLFGEAERGKD